MKKFILLVGLVLMPVAVLAILFSWKVAKKIVPDADGDLSDLFQIAEMPAPQTGK